VLPLETMQFPPLPPPNRRWPDEKKPGAWSESLPFRTVRGPARKGRSQVDRSTPTPVVAFPGINPREPRSSRPQRGLQVDPWSSCDTTLLIGYAMIKPEPVQLSGPVITNSHFKEIEECSRDFGKPGFTEKPHILLNRLASRPFVLVSKQRPWGS
jgi:hypothetical protein